MSSILSPDTRVSTELPPGRARLPAAWVRVKCIAQRPAFFGAFLVGAAMPRRGGLTVGLAEKVACHHAPRRRSVASELATQASPPHGVIGGGLGVAHALAQGPLRGILLKHPIGVATPDDVPVRALVVLVGPTDKQVVGGLVRVARLASGRLVERLCDTPTASAALNLLP